MQAPDGRWVTKAARAPTDYSDVTSTALAIRALNAYAPPTMKAGYARRTAKSARWLQDYHPESTEEQQKTNANQQSDAAQNDIEDGEDAYVVSHWRMTLPPHSTSIGFH